ncbi:MAG: cadmium-translocating P-type ATPase [Clostridia bacterium]|nr:cadmium-translocating P-type ATPase [Clostridia bacterium]
MTNKQKKILKKIIISFILFITASILPFEGVVAFVAFFAVYLFIGGDILLKAVRNIFHGNVFDENFLMAIATIGAFAIGEYAEGVFVMLFFQVGELLESYAVGKSRKSITSLMNIRPDYANVLKDGELVAVAPATVRIGDEIIIKAGERVPLDGIVVDGTTTVDTSALTGEAIPQELSKGDTIVSGCVNLSGTVTVKVTKEFGESTVSKILDLVENAAMKKAHTENFITKFSKYYTPFVVLAAVCVASIGPLFTGDAFSVWIKNALIFLVVSCPCALVISVPMAFFGGIGGASRCGILVKGSNYFELLAKARIVALDKTGTLTKGKFSVCEVIAENGYDKETVLKLAASAEKYTLHPIGISIRESYTGTVTDDIETTEIAGKGIKAEVDGKIVCVGNISLMYDEKIELQPSDDARSVVYVSYDGIYIGRIIIADTVKDTSAKAISVLKDSGVESTVMLTGDKEEIALTVAEELGIDKVYSSLLPNEKVNILEDIIASTQNGSVIYVGDGINDAPVLARADVGIGMGAFGSDAAIEAADVVLMDDDLNGVAKAIKISKKTLAIVHENIVFSLAIKGIVLILGAFGIAQMWQAVFADVGVSCIAILNAMRTLKTK